ncbi:hypothetical protein [Amnibacterium endophyticum]|uniref:Uncharacterized protein n=1 Tax=Amnibacterium endophyticum TaxID=2109337 RepID=A0ABW4LBT4_9MICO
MTSSPRQDLLDEPSDLDALAVDPLGTDPSRPHLLLASKPWAMVVAQFFPVLALGLTYPFVVEQLDAARVAGIGLSVLMVSCAVITPTLAQAVAAPVYLHLLGDRGADPNHVARTVLRVALPALLVVGPLMLFASIGVGAARQLPLSLFGAFFGLLVLHVAMGALIVPAYALRAPLLLVLPWSAYVVVLLLVPTWLWAPPVAAILLQAATLAVVGLRRRQHRQAWEPLQVGWRASAVAALRGAAEGLPLWSIPAVVWLLDVRLSSIGFVYIALLPGVLAHQLFFVRTVDPGWRLLDGARDALHALPYPEARAKFERFTRGVRAGVGQATALLLLLSMAMISGAVVMHWRDGQLLVVVVLAAFAAVAAMMQGYTLGMLGSAVPLGVLGACALVVVVGGISMGLPDVAVLGTAAALYGAYALVAVGVSRRVMHRPEHALFWRRAVQW